MSKKVFLKGTLILACTGLVSRIAGFFYRIFLSHAIGAEGLGLYQLILPLQGLMAGLSYTGIQSALSRLIASRLALQEKKEAYFSLVTGIFAAVFFSAVTGFLLFRHADFFASTILKAPGTSDLLRLTAASIPLCAIHSCIDSYYYARKKASVPAAVQLSEQAVRIGATYILYLIFLSEGRPVTAMIASGGSLAGEAAASLISLLMVSFHFGNHPVKEKTSVKIFPLIKDLFTLSFPEPHPPDTSRKHRSGSDSTDADSLWNDFFRGTENLRDLYGNGLSPAPVSFHPYNFRSCNADALCRKNGCPWRSETDPPCHRPDFFSLHVSGIFVWKRILSLWTIPWNTAFSQQNCRNLHTVSFFHLSFSLYQHHARQHPSGAWKAGALPDPQRCRHSHPYFFCCFYDSGNWDSRLFLRHFSG